MTTTKQKPWRPEGWENPNLGKRYTDCDQMPSGEDYYCCQSFEEGADAILEALKAMAAGYIPGVGWNGILIPDKEGEAIEYHPDSSFTEGAR